MKIKTIFKINLVLIFIQILPLLLSLFLPEVLNTLINDAFGQNPSPDAVKMFETFALVLSLIVIGNMFLIFGSMSFNDIDVLKRLSFLFFVISGFFALPDLIGFFKGYPTAPLPVIVLGFITLGLFFYGSKKGTL
tara:strand:- start:1945 stop:2349 length:405 start_codon:yes stop_codon:yes gene_type:complete